MKEYVETPHISEATHVQLGEKIFPLWEVNPTFQKICIRVEFDDELEIYLKHLPIIGGKLLKPYVMEPFTCEATVVSIDPLGATINCGKELEAHDLKPGDTIGIKVKRLVK